MKMFLMGVAEAVSNMKLSELINETQGHFEDAELYYLDEHCNKVRVETYYVRSENVNGKLKTSIILMK